MKKILLALFLTVAIFSCKKESDDNEQTIETPVLAGDTVDVALISSKWIIANNEEFKSIEFNESGNYIIVKTPKLKAATTTDDEVLYGTYTIVNETTIILSGFGTVIFIDFGQEITKIVITLATNPTSPITLEATEKSEITMTTKTELLCRTWDLYTVNGEEVAGTTDESTVLFSAAGTYFVDFADPEMDEYGGLAQWSWSSSLQQSFCYDWETTPVCSSTNSVSIVSLTETELKVSEDGTIFIFKPATSNKSRTLTLCDSTNILKNGFLKR
ncbi:MAG: hypothetical protein KBG80_12465 [Breznakibacter sp.]|nr:hypothetical protein [Breznakibacter sp.]